MPIRYPVLRPRCSSGRNNTFSPRSKAHFITAEAFELVQTEPPYSPVNDLIAAVEFMYVTGIILFVSVTPRSSFQHASTCPISAISAIDQPALKSGHTTT